MHRSAGRQVRRQERAKNAWEQRTEGGGGQTTRYGPACVPAKMMISIAFPHWHLHGRAVRKDSLLTIVRARKPRGCWMTFPHLSVFCSVGSNVSSSILLSSATPPSFCFFQHTFRGDLAKIHCTLLCRIFSIDGCVT